MRLIDADSMKADLLTVDPQYETMIQWCITVLDAQPTIEPERKTGKWQRKYSRPGVYADLCWHCSICGGKFSDTYANMWKHCPDCGSYNGGNNEDNS